MFVLFISVAHGSPEIIQNSYFDFQRSDQLRLETAMARKLALTLVIDVDSKWTKIALNSQLAKTQRSLEQCQIGIENIELIYVSLPEKMKAQMRVENPYLGPPELKIVKEGIPKNKLVGFLFQKIKPYGSAFAINASSVINSERYPNQPSYRPLFHTFWISDNNITHHSTPRADETYSTFAHEIVHIIGDLGHLEDNQEPNLMGSSDFIGKSYQLTQGQCEAIENYYF